MAGKARKRKYKKLRWDRVIKTAVVIAGAVFAIDAGIRNVKGEPDKNINADEFSTSVSTPDNTPEPSSEENGITFVENDGKDTKSELLFETLLPENQIYEGRLTLVNEYYEENSGVSKKLVDLAYVKNNCYNLIAETMMLDSDAAEALNELMRDYNNATDLSDFVVCGTTKKYTGEDSCYSEFFKESKLGYTVDLALNGYGEVIAYDGKDAEGWVVENCWKYGFIVRYPQGKNDITGYSYCPWHLRYVGKANAGVMHKNNICLEEYVESISAYKAENPLEYTYDSVDYMIYSIDSEGESTRFYAPNSTYSVSGNGKNGFIITVPKD